MDTLCICEVKETAINRLHSCEKQVGHIRLVAIFSCDDHHVEDFCVNVCNSDYIPPLDYENQFIHFTYPSFLRFLKWMKHLHEMLSMSKLTKLEMTANFDDEDKQRNISITIDSSESVFVVHCNGQKILIDEFAIETLMSEVLKLPEFVEECCAVYKQRRRQERKMEREIRLIDQWFANYF
ncbi:hypothetical protein QKK82_gp08 [Mayetiola barley midge adintovirus]|uniref:hypothetical protein n=1 Tax=Mayetiola barley midge adintovirus TaxID=2609858 RepID=UPI002481CEC3|nr:hypothetical protein QKK82_gp08 [Mayetiola barley midge adintovirus]DAC81326.1 TPA_asm: hypothetical protein [Mayetiola barley midge adintovirus]